MMKKRIVALLLAGLMTTTALASCRAQNSGNPNGTEPDQTTPQVTQKPDNPDNPYNPPTTWIEKTQDVYTLKDVTLRKEANGTSANLGSIPKETKLTSTKYNANWYYVEYEGNQGYVAAKTNSKPNVTEVNILGTDFVAIEGGSKTMYVNTTTLYVRLYPSSDNNFSIQIGSYNLNDEVIVLATNDTWARIQYSETEQYYVAHTYLSDAPIEDPNIVPADELFTVISTNVESAPKMYVYGVDTAAVRKAPNIKAGQVTSLEKDAIVKILRTIVIEGRKWMHVAVEIAAQKPGDDVDYDYGYISADCLAYNNGSATLEELLEIYKEFTPKTQTMYILQESSISVRNAPIFDGDKNILLSPKSGTDLKDIKTIEVLAEGVVKDEGTQKDYKWYIVEYTQNGGETSKVWRGFIGGTALDALTTDPSGKPTVTLEDLLNDYPNEYEILETPLTVTTKELANCYGTPATTKVPLKELVADTTVTLVAVQKGYSTTWAVIQDSEGAYYFVFYSKLNHAQ